MKFDMRNFKCSVEKVRVLVQSGKNNGHFVRRPVYCTCMVIIFRLILLRIRNVLDKVIEKAKTHFMSNKIFLS